MSFDTNGQFTRVDDEVIASPESGDETEEEFEEDLDEVEEEQIAE